MPPLSNGPGAVHDHRNGDPAAVAAGAVVARAQEGDADAFEQLYHMHAPRVFALALRLTGERRRAEELVQDAFVQAWQQLRSFRGESAFGSWLHRLTVNVFLLETRTTRRREQRVRTVELPEVHERVGRDADHESRMDLETAISALPKGARTALVLHDIEGYRHEEIARLLGVATGTVKAQLHRARQLLMRRLER